MGRVTMGRDIVTSRPPRPHRRSELCDSIPVLLSRPFVTLPSRHGRERRRASSSLAPPTSLQDDNGGRQWGGATATLRHFPPHRRKEAQNPLSLQSPLASSTSEYPPSKKTASRTPAGALSPTTRTEAARLSSLTSDGRLALRTRSRPVLQHIRKTQADARIARPGLQPSAHPLALSTSTLRAPAFPSCAPAAPPGPRSRPAPAAFRPMPFRPLAITPHGA